MSNFQARNYSMFCRHVLGATHQNKRPTCFLITRISFCWDEIHPFLLYPGCCYFMGLDLHISLSKEDTAITLESVSFPGAGSPKKKCLCFSKMAQMSECLLSVTSNPWVWDWQPTSISGWHLEDTFTLLPWLPHLGPHTSFHEGSFTPSSTSKSKLLKQSVPLEAHVYYCNYTFLDADYIWQCKHSIIVSVLQKREKEGSDTANLLWQ